MTAKQIVPALATALILGAHLNAPALTMREIFTDAPQDVLPMFDRYGRLYMLDYYSHSLPNGTPNTLHGESRILTLDDSRMEIAASRDGVIEMAIVPVKNDTLVAVIETVLTPVADSHIKFYKASTWEPLPSPTLPEASLFMPSRKNPQPEIFFIKATYNPADNTFVFRNTTAAYYDESERPAWLTDAAAEIATTFDGRKFAPLKKQRK